MNNILITYAELQNTTFEKFKIGTDMPWVSVWVGAFIVSIGISMLITWYINNYKPWSLNWWKHVYKIEGFTKNSYFHKKSIKWMRFLKNYLFCSASFILSLGFFGSLILMLIWLVGCGVYACTYKTNNIIPNHISQKCTACTFIHNTTGIVGAFREDGKFISQYSSKFHTPTTNDYSYCPIAEAEERYYFLYLTGIEKH